MIVFCQWDMVLFYLHNEGVRESRSRDGSDWYEDGKSLLKEILHKSSSSMSGSFVLYE